MGIAFAISYLGYSIALYVTLYKNFLNVQIITMNTIRILIVLCVLVLNLHLSHSQSNDIYKQAKNSRDFTGKVVLVTGSSSGIGEGIAKLFSVLGAKVVVTGRKEDQVKRVAQEVQELSPKKLKVCLKTDDKFKYK